MLGYDISWAAFNIIEVMSSTKFTYKVSCVNVVCVCMCVHAYVCVHVCVYMHACVHKHGCVCVRVCV